MIRYGAALLVSLALWIGGLHMAYFVFRPDLEKCWVMLWGAVVMALQVRVLRAFIK